MAGRGGGGEDGDTDGGATGAAADLDRQRVMMVVVSIEVDGVMPRSAIFPRTRNTSILPRLVGHTSDLHVAAADALNTHFLAGRRDGCVNEAWEESVERREAMEVEAAKDGDDVDSSGGGGGSGGGSGGGCGDGHGGGDAVAERYSASAGAGAFGGVRGALSRVRARPLFHHHDGSDFANLIESLERY